MPIKTKYVKVPVSERLPEKIGKYLIYHKGFTTYLPLSFNPDDAEKVEHYKNNIEFWLEEKEDHSEEMLSLLENCRNALKITYGCNVDRIEELINKVKDNG